MPASSHEEAHAHAPGLLRGAPDRRSSAAGRARPRWWHIRLSRAGSGASAAVQGGQWGLLLLSRAGIGACAAVRPVTPVDARQPLEAGALLDPQGSLVPLPGLRTSFILLACFHQTPGQACSYRGGSPLHTDGSRSDIGVGIDIDIGPQPAATLRHIVSCSITGSLLPCSSVCLHSALSRQGRRKICR